MFILVEVRPVDADPDCSKHTSWGCWNSTGSYSTDSKSNLGYKANWKNFLECYARVMIGVNTTTLVCQKKEKCGIRGEKLGKKVVRKMVNENISRLSAGQK